MIGDKCYGTFFMEGDFLDVPCLKYSVSKALGYGIMLGSGIMKMPQIIKIMKSRDVTGINAVSFYMECVAFLPSIVYNALKHYPISTYGENVIILAQNFFLVLLYWLYAVSFILRKNRYAKGDAKKSSLHKLCVVLGFLLFSLALVYCPEQVFLSLFFPIRRSTSPLSP